MFVTDCSIGTEMVEPVQARDDMLRLQERADISTAASQLRALAGLCNAGEFDAVTNHLPLHDRNIIGDATDQAVLRFSESFGPVNELRQMWKKTFEIAFNSKNKYMIRTCKLVQQEGLKTALSIAEAESFKPNDT
jgi:sodium/potassium-transporting ATPase subunit alpha